MFIRPIRPYDFDAIRRLDRDIFQDLFVQLTGKEITLEMREPEYFEFWHRTDPEGAMVAVDGDEVVGLCMCHARGHAGWIGPLGVKPSYQSRGLGGQFMAAAFGYFERRGCKWVGLDTYPENPVSVSLYLKNGMRILETMLQLQINAAQWSDATGAALSRQAIAAAASDLDELVAADERVSCFCRRPDFKFLLEWDKGAVFRLVDRGICSGQVCAYQKRQKGFIGGLLLSRLDNYAADAKTMISACVSFFRAINVAEAVVLCPGDDRRLFDLMFAWNARTVRTTVRLFKGDGLNAPMLTDRPFLYTPFASEKG